MEFRNTFAFLLVLMVLLLGTLGKTDKNKTELNDVLKTVICYNFIKKLLSIAPFENISNSAILLCVRL